MKQKNIPRCSEEGNGIVERSPGGRYVRFCEKLGSGASKYVYRAYDTQQGIEVAWNAVNLSGLQKEQRHRIVNEVRLLERLHHPNIINFYGSWVNRERQEIHFVTEILPSGTLKAFIMKGVIHRDLKCDNIFINGTSGDLRIGDMGLCTVQRTGGPAHSVLGTPEFMAPDMYEEHVSYNEKVDIYSLGMCILEICTHETPYAECSNPAQIYRKVSKGEYPLSLNRVYNPEIKGFIYFCLGRKSSLGGGRYIRPSAAQLLKHPFLIPNADDDDEVLIDASTNAHSITYTGTLSYPPSLATSNSSILGLASNSASVGAIPKEQSSYLGLRNTSWQVHGSKSTAAQGERILSAAESIFVSFDVTLPIRGHAPKVRFSFDLVKDDPLEVAREIVSEFGMPQKAVFEVREMICGLVQGAKLKKEAKKQEEQQLPLQQLFQKPQPTLMQVYQPSISSHQIYPSFTKKPTNLITATSAHMVMPETGDALVAPTVVTDA